MPDQASAGGLGREFSSLLDRIDAVARLPEVKALHVPPVPADWQKRSAFCAVELDDGSVGLSYISLGDTHDRLRTCADSFVTQGARVGDLIRGWDRADEAYCSVALAALNAATRCLFDRAGYKPGLRADILAGIAPGAHDHVGMVGLFTPLVEPLRASGARLTVLELDPAVAGSRTDCEITLDRSAVASCSKALCTSAVLINGTLDTMLRSFIQAQTFVLIGPGAACLPDPLFARGVTALGGTWVSDAPALIDALRAGASWGRYADKFVLDAHRYPGLPALIERL